VTLLRSTPADASDVWYWVNWRRRLSGGSWPIREGGERRLFRVTEALEARSLAGNRAQLNPD
jgi:hypothetical protein